MLSARRAPVFGASAACVIALGVLPSARLLGLRHLSVVGRALRGQGGVGCFGSFWMFGLGFGPRPPITFAPPL